MPIYTCTTTESTLTADSKTAAIYTDGRPAAPVLVSGWVRAGHPDADTTRLATEIATAVTRITGVPAERVMVVFVSSPAHYAVAGQTVSDRTDVEVLYDGLPEPIDLELELDSRVIDWTTGVIRRAATGQSSSSSPSSAGDRRCR